MSKLLSIFTMTAVIIHASAFKTFAPPGLNYLIFLLSFLILFLKDFRNTKKVNLYYFLFITSCALSILLNDTPGVFRSIERLIIFIIITLFIGPSISSKLLNVFRFKLFDHLNKAIALLSALSVLLLITGIFTGLSTRGEYSERPDFTGLFNHSMILGPLSGLSMISISYWIAINKTVKKKSILFLVLFLCFLSLLAAGSRGAILSTIFGFSVLFSSYFKGEKVKSVLIVFLSLIIIYLSSPLLLELSGQLIGKLENSEAGVFLSRQAKWTSRIEEFASSPFNGIGFATIDINSMDNYDMDNGVVEPGSSWLAIASMTGLFGLISFIMLLINLYPKGNDLHSKYLKAYFWFFMIHLITEGYIVSAGASLFFFFWLFLGILFQNKTISLRQS